MPKLRILLLLIIVIMCYAPLPARCQVSGILKHISKQLTGVDTVGVPIFKTDERMLWFKDSTVIHEIRTNLVTEESTVEGTLIKRSKPVRNYSILNLRSMIAQDYLVFKDTAKPLTNYKVKPDEIILWKPVKTKEANDTPHGFSVLPDTTIGSICYKRVKVLYKYYPEVKDYSVYYLKPTTAKNIFQMNKSVDEIYPGWSSTYLEYFDERDSLIITIELRIVRDKLTEDEENVFKHWTENAVVTSLPLLSSVAEAMSVEIKFPEHENPEVIIVPRSKH